MATRAMSSLDAGLSIRVVLLALIGIVASGAPLHSSLHGSAMHVFPLGFEQSGSAWVARGPGYRLALQHGGAILALSNGRGRASVIGMQVLGARRASSGVPLEEAPGRRNYLTGSDPKRWRSNVRVWDKVRFAGVLDGIDIVYRGAGQGFEYDLEVAPGADPGAIRIEWTGADELKLNRAGDLVLHTSTGDLVQRKPVAYQVEGTERREVAASFRLEDGRVRFDLGRYDRSKPLVIDPIIDYATWFPANITLIAADSSGSAYMTGTISAPVLPVTPHAYQQYCGTDKACNTPQNKLNLSVESGRNSDLFIAKFSSDGSTLIYCTYLGGSGRDIPVGIAVDGAGNAIVAGSTTSADFPLTPGLYSTLDPSGTSTFAAKLSADGSSLLWSTLLPSPGLTDLALDNSGNVFLLTSPMEPGVFTTPNPISTGPAPRWLGELDASGGRLVYATYVPGMQSASTSGAMAVGKDGTVWIAGTAPGFDLSSEWDCAYTLASDWPRTSAVVVGVDVIRSKLAQTISIGGSLQDRGNSLALDSEGNIYLGGSTCSPDFPGFDPSLFGQGLYNKAGFLVKLAAGSGTRLWTWSSTAPVWAAVTDPAGNAAVTSSPPNWDQPGPPSAFSEFLAGIYYIEASGNLLWTTQGIVERLGIPGVLPELTMDSHGRIYAMANVGGTAGAWESAPPAAIPGVKPLVLMTIEPRGGELMVLPETIDLSEGDLNLLVASAGATALPVDFTVSTSTPWLSIGNPMETPQLVTLLPNWLGSPPTNLKIAASISLPGTYEGAFTVTSPGFANSPLTVPVHVVIPPPASFSPLPREIVIYPSVLGGSFLGPYLNLLSSSNQTITSATSWIVPTANGRDATIDFSALPSGMNRGQVTVSVPGDPNSPCQVAVLVVTGETGPASPNVAPGALSFLAQPDDSPKHAGVALWPTLSIRQSFTAVSESSWVSVSPGSGTMPQILAITANPAGLQPGTYSTHIDISVNEATKGGVRIPVTFRIQNVVPFNVDPAAIAVSLPAGYKLPGAKAEQITLTLSSSEPTSYQTEQQYLWCSMAPQSGTAPGLVRVTLDPALCAPLNTQLIDYAEYLGFVTSGNDVVDVPIAIMMPGLFPLIEPGGIVNGATFAPGPVAPASIVSIFGVDLAGSSHTASSIPLDNSSPAGTGAPAVLYVVEPGFFYVSPNQWNIQIPSMLPGTYQLAIGSSPIASFTVVPIAPYIFVWNTNRAVAQNTDYSLNQPSNPAAAGSAIMVYLTGQGAVDPPVPDRFAAPARPLSRVTATATAAIDGHPADVLFAGLAPGLVGVGQVNVGIPAALPPGEHKLVIAIGGVNTNEVEISTK